MPVTHMYAFLCTCIFANTYIVTLRGMLIFLHASAGHVSAGHVGQILRAFLCAYAVEVTCVCGMHVCSIVLLCSIVLQVVV